MGKQLVINAFNICLTDSAVVSLLFDGYSREFLEWALNTFQSMPFLVQKSFFNENESFCEKKFAIHASSGFDQQLLVFIFSLG